MGLLGAMAGLAAPSVRAQDRDALQFSGYYKNQLVDSRTWVGEAYALDLNRVRLALKGKLGPAISFDVQYDNEAWLGSYLRTSQFQQQKQISSPQYWSAQSVYADDATLYGVQRLYRAQMQITLGDTALRLGRQRIAWGTGRFWSPLDVLNPLSLMTLEREERPGVDAVVLEHRFGPVANATAVYVPGRQPVNDSQVVQWHDNAWGVDYSIVGGSLRGDHVAGFDLAGQLGGAGWHAEFAQVQPQVGGSFARVLAGADYAFANTLTLGAELYRDGSGASDRMAYDFAALLSGARQTVAQHYLGVHAGYEITPLLKLGNDLVMNLDDRSRFITASMTYSLKTNWDGAWGVRWFSGDMGTEYSRASNLVFVTVQRYF